VQTGIGTSSTALYRPDEPMSLELVGAMIVDLQNRLMVVCERITEASEEMACQVEAEAAKGQLASHQAARFPNAPRPTPAVPGGRTGTNRPEKS
jgi:hypothetical protein